MALFGQNPIMGTEDQDDKNQFKQPAPGSIIQGAGDTSVATGKGLGGPQKSTSGRTANLQSYLKANVGSNLGEKVGEKVQAQTGQIAQNIAQAKTQLQQAAAPEQSRLSQYQQYAQKIEQDPTQFSPEQVAEFQKYRTGQYVNPEVSNLSQLQSQSQRAQDLAGMAETEAGRFQLLKESFGRPTYSTGQQRLDQLLLQADKPSSAALTSQARSAKQQALQNIQGLTAEQQALQQALGTQAGQVQTQAGELLSGQKSALQKAAEEQFGQAQQESSGQEQTYNELLRQFAAQSPGGEGRVGTMVFNEGDTSNYIGRDPNRGRSSTELKQAYKTLDQLLSRGIINQDSYNMLNKQAERAEAGGSGRVLESIKGGLGFQQASGLTQEGVTTPEQRARFQALQRLAGETESQFAPEQYQAAKTTFSADPLSQSAAARPAPGSRAEQEQHLAKTMEYAQKIKQFVDSGHDRGSPEYWQYDAQIRNELNQKFPYAGIAENPWATFYSPDAQARYNVLKQSGLA